MFPLVLHNDLDGEHRIQVHVLGISPSPSVVIYGLKNSTVEGEADHCSEVRHFVEKNFYVDDGLVSLPIESKVITLLHNTQDMLALSNLRLHKISSNIVNVMRAFPAEDLAKGLKDLYIDTALPPMQRSLGVSLAMMYLLSMYKEWRRLIEGGGGLVYSKQSL